MSDLVAYNLGEANVLPVDRYADEVLWRNPCLFGRFKDVGQQTISHRLAETRALIASLEQAGCLELDDDIVEVKV